jgi:hypothetical protein
MIKKPTWILLIIFLLALGSAVFLDKNPGITAGLHTSTPTLYPNLLSGFSSASASSIEFTPTQGEHILIEKKADNSWEIKGLEKTASQGKIEQLLTNISDLKIFAVMASGLKLDEVGLSQNPALLKIEYISGQGKLIKIGKLTQTDSGYYAQVDDGPILVISKFGLTSVLDMLNPPSLLGDSSQ